MEKGNKSQEITDSLKSSGEDSIKKEASDALATFSRPPGSEEPAKDNEMLSKILSYSLIAPVRFYQLAISPLLGKNCRHVPSCSQYTIEAIQEWGPVKGSWMGAKRISRCHPWGTHGYDPVPKKPAK